jgi:hypothetical protein
MTLKLSVSVIVFLKFIPVSFELNNWNFVDLEQEKNNDTVHKRNKSFLMLFNYNKNKYLQLSDLQKDSISDYIICFLIPTMTYFLNYLSPNSPPGGRGYNIIYHVVTPFSRFAGRGQGMR